VQILKARNLPGTIELVHLDVSDEHSVGEAAKEVGEKFGRYIIYHTLLSPLCPTYPNINQNSLDALVNNAAISGEYDASLSQRLTAAFLTNTTGPAIVVEFFAPLLLKSTKTPRIVNVTSGAGSISLRLDDTNPHQKRKVVCLTSFPLSHNPTSTNTS
jgi:NAD(P)-dependent dehydrogenase (short-subunit alcohol dehydrogenase family)